VIVGMLAGLIVLQKDLGTALALLITTALLLYMAGLNMKWIRVADLCALSIDSHPCVLESGRRSTGIWLPDHSIHHGRRYRRYSWAGLHGKQAEALLSSGRAHGFH